MQSNIQTESRLFTTVEAAKYLGVSYSTIRRLAYAGELPVVKAFSKGWRVDRQDLDTLISRRKMVL